MLEVDHVIAVVADLDRAATQLFEEHGLRSVAGGRHPGHGTANRIIPLGDGYLELMSIVDHDEAATSPMGVWAGHHTQPGIRPISLCLRTDDIERIATELDESPLAMRRQTPSGDVLSWRLAGFDGMVGPQRLPFFIQWDSGDHPGAAAADHARDVLGIAAVTIGDPGDRAHLISGVTGINIADGIGVQSVTIATGTGEIRLG